MNGFVYAIGDGEGRVKIGWSGDPLRRLADISVGCAGEARLLGVIEATRDQETEAHRLLARWRTNGEWFRLEGPVQAFVDMLPAPHDGPYVAAPSDASPLGQAIEAVGSAAELAAQLGITAQALSQWERVPHLRVLEVERLTGVPRHELRPDIYPPADSRRRR